MELLIRKQNILPAYIFYLLICLIPSYFFYIWGFKLNFSDVITYPDTRNHIEFVANFGLASIFFFGAISAKDVKYHPDKFTINKFFEDILSISIQTLILAGLLAFFLGWAVLIIGIIAGTVLGIILAVIIGILSYFLNNNLFAVIDIIAIISYSIVIVVNIHCFQTLFSREEDND